MVYLKVSLNENVLAIALVPITIILFAWEFRLKDA
jgi:hypothetical protein